MYSPNSVLIKLFYCTIEETVKTKHPSFKIWILFCNIVHYHEFIAATSITILYSDTTFILVGLHELAENSITQVGELNSLAFRYKNQVGRKCSNIRANLPCGIRLAAVYKISYMLLFIFCYKLILFIICVVSAITAQN